VTLGDTFVAVLADLPGTPVAGGIPRPRAPRRSGRTGRGTGRRTRESWPPKSEGRTTVETAVEVARRRLRRGLRLEAAELLDRCVQVVKPRLDDQNLTELWAYAHDRCTGDGDSSLAPEVLQRVITWLTREELEDGERELAADRPFAAARCFHAADAIDARGTRSALWHARALHRAAEKAIARSTASRPTADAPAHLRRAERCLRRAAGLARRAGADPALRIEAEALVATIEARLPALTEVRAGTDRLAAACACLVDYDAFVSHYRNQAQRSPLDHDNFRTSLDSLAGRISRLRVTAPVASAEARLLATMANGVADMQRAMTSDPKAPANHVPLAVGANDPAAEQWTEQWAEPAERVRYPIRPWLTPLPPNRLRRVRQARDF
jgi:hypothetical protein